MPAKKKAASKDKTKANLPKIRHLLTDSAGELKKHPRLLWIAAIVLIPSRFLANSAEGTVLSTLATIVMNLALIWAIMEIHAGRKVTAKNAYFRGTAPFVRFLLVALILVLMLVPMVIALSIVSLGILPPSALLIERMLLALVALVLAAPTVFWLTRYSFGLFTIFDGEIGPLAALKASGNLVKGKWFAVAKRLAVIVVLMSLAASLPLLWFAFTKAVPSQWSVTIIQWITGIVGLPYLSVYLHRVFRALDGQSQSR